MTKNKILAAAAALSIGVASLSTIAFANDNNKITKHEDSKKNTVVITPGSLAEISVGSQGKIYLSGAKVTVVNGSVITVNVSPVGLSLNFNLNTTSTSSVIKRYGHKAVLADIKVGDYLSVRGTLVSGANTPTVAVTSIRDYSLENNPILQKVVFDGKLVSLAGTAAPTTLVATFNNKNYTVVVPAGISIVNYNYQSVSLSNYKVGDNIRVYGAVRAADNSTIDASILRDVSLK